LAIDRLAWRRLLAAPVEPRHDANADEVGRDSNTTVTTSRSRSRREPTGSVGTGA
jgi:hypothetical protein